MPNPKVYDEEERSAEAEIHMLEERAYHQFGMSAREARNWAEERYSENLKSE